MTKIELIEQIKKVSYLTGEFLLRSGKISSFYWDKYRFESNPILLDAICQEMQKLLPNSFDKLAGLELGGIPLASVLSLKTNKPCLFVRKISKNYGTCNLVEGGFQKGEEIVVIEDVVTTAGQVCTSINQMRDLGLKIQNVICVIDREQGGRENIEKIGCSFKSVFTMKELQKISN